MANRFNAGKLDWALLPDEALTEVVRVMMMGALKYGRSNWKTEPYLSEEDWENSLKRHVVARKAGVLFDDESRLLHTAHIACNALMWLYHDLNDSWDNLDHAADEAFSISYKGWQEVCDLMSGLVPEHSTDNGNVFTSSS